MARAGSGGGGGHRSSSGGHRSSSGGHRSNSRSGSGHRTSSRSRAGAGTNRSGGFSSSHRYHSSPPRPPRPPRRHYGGRTHTVRHVYTNGSSGGSFGSAISAFLIIVLVIMTIMSFRNGFSVSVGTSSYDREKANANASFNSDCIIDEIGWFDSVSSTGRNLKGFYEETGVQPFIVFKDYDSSLTSDDQKADYAASWYDENIDDEGTFLFMYFAEQDVDGEVGYMHCIVGNQIASVMDNEAQDIFWDYVDTYWYSDLSTDDMAVTIFNKTADRIMTKTTNVFDVGKVIVLVGGAVVVLIILRKMQKAKHQRQREEAAETERILNTPLNTDVTDSTLERYR